MPDVDTTRLRLDIAYDGTDFHGWATQPKLRTVQGTLEDALTAVLRLPEPARLVVAGRTDSGVHATGQVAHVDVPTSKTSDVALISRRLRGALKRDPDLVVTGVSFAAEGFDARFSPLARRYEYRIADAAAQIDPLERHRVVQVPAVLDLRAMNEAAAMMLGLRDFGAFCKPRAGATTIRELQQFDWVRGERGILIGHLRADAFCHSMVRALVGSSVAAGAEKLSLAALAGVRDAAERTSAFKVMPAHGLNLVEVIYPDDAELAERAEQTRGRRDLPEE